jgi:hypothetical protein
MWLPTDPKWKDTDKMTAEELDQYMREQMKSMPKTKTARTSTKKRGSIKTIPGRGRGKGKAF